MYALWFGKYICGMLLRQRLALVCLRFNKTIGIVAKLHSTFSNSNKTIYSPKLIEKAFLLCYSSGLFQLVGSISKVIFSYAQISQLPKYIENIT
jgi:hypothetical protein